MKDISLKSSYPFRGKKGIISRFISRLKERLISLFQTLGEES